jgi:hypothetical protein
MRTFLIVLAVLAATVAAVLLLAGRGGDAATAEAVARLQPKRPDPATFSAGELSGLPAPVARYLRAVLREGHPLPRAARIEWRGDFLVSPPDGWGPFTATQVVAIQPGGFVWDARMNLAPGVGVRVRDSFVHGTGSMRAKALGLFTVVSVEGTPQVATAALQRWLAEAAWYPAALLPRQGTEWTALDETSARATVRVAGVTASIDYHFGADGLVERVYAAERGREVDGRSVPTPWEGRLTEWGEIGGARVPVTGEVAWLLPEGRQAYWRGRLAGIAYDDDAPDRSHH